MSQDVSPTPRDVGKLQILKEKSSFCWFKTKCVTNSLITETIEFSEHIWEKTQVFGRVGMSFRNSLKRSFRVNFMRVFHKLLESDSFKGKNKEDCAKCEPVKDVFRRKTKKKKFIDSLSNVD